MTTSAHVHVDDALLKVLAERAGRVDAESVWPATSWEALRQAGVLQWSIPPAHGGMGLGELALLEGYEALAQLPKDTPIAFICNVGISSRAAAERFAAHGFTQIFNVEGGMDAWMREVGA